jgi:PAS domain-containing protein
MFHNILDGIDKEQIVDYMREIAQERDLLVLIFESMIEGMIVIDSDENVVYINQSARSILGLGDGPTVPDLPLKRLLDSPLLLDLCRDCIQSQKPILSKDFHLKLPGGTFPHNQYNPPRKRRQRPGSLFLYGMTINRAQELKLRDAKKRPSLNSDGGRSHEIAIR